VTCPVTSNESLFTNKRWAPNSFVSNIPTIKASYSVWLFLALNANLRACSIKSPFGPSRMTPALLPYWLEDPSTEKTHWKSLGLSWESLDESSTIKFTYTWPLICPHGSYCMLNSKNSTAQRTIRPTMSRFWRTLQMGKSVITIIVKL